MTENLKNSSKGRSEPKSIEAEKAVLGSMLISKEAIPRAMTFLSTHCFYEENHRIIFDNIMKLYENNTAVDSVSLVDILKKTRN